MANLFDDNLYHRKYRLNISSSFSSPTSENTPFSSFSNFLSRVGHLYPLNGMTSAKIRIELVAKEKLSVKKKKSKSLLDVTIHVDKNQE